MGFVRPCRLPAIPPRDWNGPQWPANPDPRLRHPTSRPPVHWIVASASNTLRKDLIGGRNSQLLRNFRILVL